MVLKAAFRWAAACALGGAVLWPGAVTDATYDAPPPPDDTVTAPVATSTATMTMLCPAPTVIMRDDAARPWIPVTAHTKDGVEIEFDLHIAYRFHQAATVDTMHDCAEAGRHILGLAGVAFAAEIFKHDYTELPLVGAGLPQRAAAGLNTTLRQVMGTNAPDITGMGIINARAPGLNTAQATAMLTQGLALPRYTPPPFTAQTHDGHDGTFTIAMDYVATPQSYERFGPHGAAITATVTEAVYDALENVAATTDSVCFTTEKDVAESALFLRAQAVLNAQDTGIRLLATTITDHNLPQGTESCVNGMRMGLAPR